METKQYQIISLDNGSYLIISKGWVRPEFYFENIAHDLASFGEISNVFFDFLLKNGPKDRFYEAIFNKAEFSFKSFIPIKDNSELLKKSNEFFSSNLDLVTGSYLTKAQKFLLKKDLKSIKKLVMEINK